MKGLVWALILRSYLVFKEMGGAMLNYAIALPFCGVCAAYIDYFPSKCLHN